MGEKKEQEKGEAGKKNAEGEKKENKPIAVVLKIDMHCQGCVTKICKFLHGFPGVETVSLDIAQNKVTVNGVVDPLKIRDKLHSRTKKKVDLISPQPKKGENQEKKKPENQKNQDSDKKPKETPVTTTVLKLAFHCHGCTEKIRKIVSKTRGVHDFTMDEQKEQVTVKGTIDIKALTENMKEKLKRPVNIVPPKKEKGNGSGDGEDGGGGNGNEKKNKKEKWEEEAGEGEVEGSDQMMRQFGHKITPQNAGEYWYGSCYAAPVHAPQLFSDENPNACAVM